MSEGAGPVLLDANVILRFLLDDHDTLSPRAADLFGRAALGEWALVVPSVVLAECVYTLRSFYKVERPEVATSLLAVLSLPGVRPTQEQVARDALHLFAGQNVDFADAYVSALALAGGQRVASFDRDLAKLGVTLVGQAAGD